MSFADEMRRKSLEAQSIAAEKARAEEEAKEAKALALEESKRNNCIPELKKQIQQAASNGLCEAIIKGFGLNHSESSRPSREMIEMIENLEVNSFLENLELHSFLTRGSSTLDEYDRMRIAFIKAEPGLSLTLVAETKTYWHYDCGDYYHTALWLKVVW
ncbi:hypothetical protein [Microcoleus sp. herbarium14]|uniref:hypothetical protein n=1 Tax=Microcoleus sp. herbarium14 TaxID=3055439 RepID=UPI002FCF193D